MREEMAINKPLSGRVFKIRIIFMFKLFIKTPHNLL